MNRMETQTFIISCEHATNDVPAAYRELLGADCALLGSHRGYDPGALEFAGLLADTMGSPLFVGRVSRLLVDLNRTLGNHRSPPIPSRPALSCSQRAEILSQYYHPYRQQVERAVADRLAQGKRVLHLSIHSFTPVLAGVTRSTDVGFLYDPRRPLEKEFCGRWRARLAAREGSWRLRRNYPYRGSSDGFVTALRRKFPAERYLGLELEINQHYPLNDQEGWGRLQQELLTSLLEVVGRV